MRTLPVISKVLRTPESRFANLPDFPYTPHYTEVGGLRIAHLDEGPRDAPPVLLMHGEPTWSFLYRKMIPVLVAAGCRVIVPDLVGFGRSDKPADKADYSYLNHVLWMTEWMEANDLRRLTLFCQDWGSLIGLRMAAEAPDRFDRIVLANGGLPTGTTPIPVAFKVWRAFARYSPWFPIGRIVKAGCVNGLESRGGCRLRCALSVGRISGCRAVVSGLRADHPGGPRTAEQRARLGTVQTLGQAFPDPVQRPRPRDPRRPERIWQKAVPGAQGQPHAVIRDAGHFLQEDKGAEVAQAIVAFMKATPASREKEVMKRRDFLKGMAGLSAAAVGSSDR